MGLSACVWPFGVCAASAIFVLLSGFAGAPGKVLGAAGSSGAATEELRGAAGVPVTPSSVGDRQDGYKGVGTTR